MQRIKRKMLVEAAPSVAFQIVNNIANYQDFLPRCSGSRILESGDNWLNAELKIEIRPMAVRLRTHNVWRVDDYIEISQLSGPFRTLVGRWAFEPQDDAHCNVSLDMRFQLKPPLSLAVGPGLIEQVVEQIITAFHEQIDKYTHAKC